jgi:predicted signal transduction protein with EAL and GGDEF domain
VPIGEWVLATACAQNKHWQDQGLTNLGIAVNLSARQFADSMLLPKLTRIIHASGLDPSSLELEITESVVMSHGESAVAVLEKLKFDRRVRSRLMTLAQGIHRSATSSASQSTPSKWIVRLFGTFLPTPVTSRLRGPSSQWRMP